MCRRGECDSCAWFEVAADYKRSYWCEHDCHDGGSVLDLTASPTPARSTETRELVSQE